MLVILDRDGVINKDSSEYIVSANDWDPIEGSIEAIARLSKQGYKIAIATNQSGVGRGYFSRTELNKMHDKMCQLVTQAGGSIAFIAYCPHLPDDNCECRKPLTGLLEQIQAALADSFDNAYMVGDSLKDLQAATAMGIRPALVETGNGLTTLTQLKDAGLEHVPVYKNLAGFVDDIINTEHPMS